MKIKSIIIAALFLTPTLSMAEPNAKTKAKKKIEAAKKLKKLRNKKRDKDYSLYKVEDLDQKYINLGKKSRYAESFD